MDTPIMLTPARPLEYNSGGLRWYRGYIGGDKTNILLGN